uniref:Uncharacterized protein n=1 Tax=Rhizophora mucronata TaxID=61149 RepID=A0A2P2QBB4_RHIMU
MHFSIINGSFNVKQIYCYNEMATRIRG